MIHDDFGGKKTKKQKEKNILPINIRNCRLNTELLRIAIHQMLSLFAVHQNQHDFSNQHLLDLYGIPVLVSTKGVTSKKQTQ